ncbi:hypothetical protein lerEdw1_017269 [Lerista edwardsae]|nr:hypothetical protein lerEdw1_017269 [Lerista edwardsae]
MKGSCEDSWQTTLESGLVEAFHFHYPTYWEPELNAHLQHCSRDGKQDQWNSSATLTMPLKLLSEGQEMTVNIPASGDTNLELKLHTNTCSEHLDVRLGVDLCGKEKSFLHKRQQLVAAALKNALQLEDDLLDHEVPVVAIMALGGGCRAMAGLYGQLSGLKKLDLLDCITYISGASGSAWAMSNLYEDANWSRKELERPINDAKKQMTKNKTSTFSLEHLMDYQRKLSQRSKESISTSFNDLQAVALENILHDKVRDFKLSDQQKAVNQGQNPLPLYFALNVKENQMSTLDFNALWSNTLAANLLDVWNNLSHTDESWQQLIQSKIRNTERNCVPPESSTSLGTSWMYPDGLRLSMLRDTLTHCPLHHPVPNFLKGFQMHKDYCQESQFSMWKDCQLDQSPNRLTPSEDDICLVDPAYFINTSCPPLLRQERKVDIIFSFDYSLDRPFQVSFTMSC